MSLGRILGNVATLVTLMVVWLLVIVVLAQKNRIEGAENTAVSLRSDIATLQSSRSPDPSALLASFDTGQADRVVSLGEDITDLRNDIDALRSAQRQQASDLQTQRPDPAVILSLRQDVTDMRESIAGYENALRGLRLSLAARNDGGLEQEIGALKADTQAMKRDLSALQTRFDDSSIQ